MVDDLLAAGGTALWQRRWADARSSYQRVLEVEERADALEGLAVAAWWQDDLEAAIRARERAYVLRRDAGETVEAARDAGFLAWDHGAMRGATAVASGWLRRAQRLAEALPPSAEHAWLPLIEASFHIDTDPGAVLRLSREAGARAGALGGLDIEMTARTLEGLALVSLGEVERGTRLLDEGTAAATAGELHDPIAIGSCCCNMVMACERARDFERARQWCDVLAGVSDRTGQRPLLALCRAHNGTVLMMRGEWRDAEEELAWAARELERLRPALTGYARARLAQLRRRQGRHRAALDLVGRADGHVLAPLVHAELALDAGDPSAAAGHAERHLRRLGGELTIERAGALELLVSARSRLGEPDAAREAHAELARIADAVGTDPLQAAERLAAGRIALAGEDAAAARRALEDALDLYERSGVPFEAAQVRLELAAALVALGQEGAALEQAVGARAAFEALGAGYGARVARAAVARLGGRRAAIRLAGLTAREVEVLSLVAGGLSNREIAERLVVSEHTVHRHLANVYVRLGVSSRAAAVAVAAKHELLP